MEFDKVNHLNSTLPSETVRFQNRKTWEGIYIVYSIHELILDMLHSMKRLSTCNANDEDIDFDEVDKRKGETFKELFGNMKVCKGHAHQTKIGSDKNSTRRTDCDVFVGHLWIDVKDETLPSRISRLRLVLGCITVMNSGLRELNFSLLSLLIYNERRCRPYVLRLVNNENLTSITFHENFTMPDSHLILFAGKHSLTEESITPRMEGYRLPKDSDGDFSVFTLLSVWN
ncbi:unnamed protein product [Haemonchus placei]|uniref:Recep_L_domain domain-containing protein n=1 Tax=Haemonchus placei TaxID=6290 RepID=A0A158QQD5_HAEPC|nr:unnamed protein product [Haemonchus placei]